MKHDTSGNDPPVIPSHKNAHKHLHCYVLPDGFTALDTTSRFFVLPLIYFCYISSLQIKNIEKHIRNRWLKVQKCKKNTTLT